MRVHKLPLGARNGFNGRRFHYIYACRQGDGSGEPDARAAGAAGAPTMSAEARCTRLLVAACAAHDDGRAVCRLLARGASAVSTEGNLQGTTPCMVAAGVGAIDCLRALAEAAGKRHLCEARDLCGHVALACLKRRLGGA